MSAEMQLKITRAIGIRDRVYANELTRRERIEAVKTLWNDRIWNAQHVANIVGYSYNSVRNIVDELPPIPSSVSGGKFNPETLDLILLVLSQIDNKNYENRELIGKIVDMGTSNSLLHRLTGLGIGKVTYDSSKYQAVKAAKEREAAKHV